MIDKEKYIFISAKNNCRDETHRIEVIADFVEYPVVVIAVNRFYGLYKVGDDPSSTCKTSVNIDAPAGVMIKRASSYLGLTIDQAITIYKYITFAISKSYGELL